MLIWITLLYLMSTIDSDWTIRTTQWAQLEVGNISSLCPSLVTPSAWKPWQIAKAPLRENTSNGESCNLNFAFIWHTPNYAIPLLENFQHFLFLAEWSSHSFACDLRFSPICPQLQLFYRENFPRGLHLRNSLPTTCHSLDVFQDFSYSFCELISQVRSPHLAIHWLNPIHPSNPVKFKSTVRSSSLKFFSIYCFYHLPGLSMFCFLLLLDW